MASCLRDKKIFNRKYYWNLKAQNLITLCFWKYEHHFDIRDNFLRFSGFEMSFVSGPTHTHRQTEKAFLEVNFLHVSDISKSNKPKKKIKLIQYFKCKVSNKIIIFFHLTLPYTYPFEWSVNSGLEHHFILSFNRVLKEGLRYGDSQMDNHLLI